MDTLISSILFTKFISNGRLTFVGDGRRIVTALGTLRGYSYGGFHLAFTWEKPAFLPGLARLA